MTRLVPARSSFLATRRNSPSALVRSPAWAAARTFLTWVLRADLTALFFARRSRLWRWRFLALLVVGIVRCGAMIIDRRTWNQALSQIGGSLSSGRQSLS